MTRDHVKTCNNQATTNQRVHRHGYRVIVTCYRIAESTRRASLVTNADSSGRHPPHYATETRDYYELLFSTFSGRSATRGLQYTRCSRVTPDRMIMVAKVVNTALWTRKSVASWGMSTFRKVSEINVSYPTPHSLSVKTWNHCLWSQPDGLYSFLFNTRMSVECFYMLRGHFTRRR